MTFGSLIKHTDDIQHSVVDIMKELHKKKERVPHWMTANKGVCCILVVKFVLLQCRIFVKCCYDSDRFFERFILRF